MKITKIYIFITIFLLFFLVCCTEENKGKIVAEVGNNKLYENELRTLFTKQEWDSLTQEKKEEILHEWVEITLLAKEAKSLGLDKREDVKFDIKYSKNTILANKLLAEKLKKINVSNEEIFQYYNINRPSFTKNITSYKIQSFIVKNWTIADSALKLYNDGEAFYTIAKNLGRNYTVKYVKKDDISKKLWDFIEKMKKWNIRIINENNELLFLQLLDIKKEKLPIKYQIIKDSLKTLLLERKRKSFLNNAMDSLKINYKVIIY